MFLSKSANKKLWRMPFDKEGHTPAYVRDNSHKGSNVVSEDIVISLFRPVFTAGPAGRTCRTVLDHPTEAPKRSLTCNMKIEGVRCLNPAHYAKEKRWRLY